MEFYSCLMGLLVGIIIGIMISITSRNIKRSDMKDVTLIFSKLVIESEEEDENGTR